MGLGPLTSLGLAEARQQAEDLRRQVLNGIDPLDERKRQRAARTLQQAQSLTFREAAKRCIAARSAEWRNAKHAAQWSNTLHTYADPVIGDLPVQDVDTASVLRVLEPIWESKTETARRVRQRIETVIDYCRARGVFKGENPARYDGHLKQLLANPARFQRVMHHPALPYQQVHNFVVALGARQGIAAVALEFLIQTACRTGEVIAAKWEEFDLHSAIWTIPAERMKARKTHRVPLNTRAMQILRELEGTSTGDYVFTSPVSRDRDRPLSNAAMLALMKSMPSYAKYVPHGFRSTFRDWASETTAYANETVELALAHTITNKVEAAYRREDQLDKRRSLMEDWCSYLGGST